jgi:hypothetical protein
MGGNKEHYRNQHKSINPALVEYLNTVPVRIYFTYPPSKLEAMNRLFESQGKPLTIRPLAVRKSDSAAGRGGPGASISFPLPKDMSLLSDYPSAEIRVRGCFYATTGLRYARISITEWVSPAHRGKLSSRKSEVCNRTGRQFNLFLTFS